MLMIGADVDPPTGNLKRLDHVHDFAGVGANCSGQLNPHHLEGYIKMAWADSLLGPWERCQNVHCFLLTLKRSHHTMVTPGDINDWDAMVLRSEGGW